MAETIKSALFVDYDSIHRSLATADKDAADRLAQRTGAWVTALEAGRLLTSKDGTTTRRRALIRRCYADPQLLGKNRATFIASGFEVIDCPPLEGRERSSADIHMMLDTMDALEHPTGYDEFIVLTADTDLTPVLARLRAHNRSAAIYANAATPAPYRAIPGAVLDQATLLQLLNADESLVAAEADPAMARAAQTPGALAAPLADRSDIEVLARKVHNATSVPLFSPRTFADLFRALAQEIAENGYHFQNTAENVSNKLGETGRNVTRRQVVFVVKGLALKGHVFSTTDTSEKLAEVFREQVIYLIGSSGLVLEDREKALLPSWIAGRVAQPGGSGTETAEATGKNAGAEPKATKKRGAKPAQAPAKPAAAAAKAPAPAKKPAPAEEPPKAAAPAPTPPPAPVTPPPAPVAAPPKAETPAPRLVPVPPPRPTRTIEEIKAAVAARAAALRPSSSGPPPAQPRPAALANPRPNPVPPPQQRPAQQQAPRPTVQPAPPPLAPRTQTPLARPTPPAPVPPPRAPAPPPRMAETSKEALESSILAAIAQAVDVLVEDSTTPPPRDETPAAPPMTSPTPEPQPVPSDGGEGDDIGDEIQRIIASYSRSRQQGEPQ